MAIPGRKIASKMMNGRGIMVPVDLSRKASKFTTAKHAAAVAKGVRGVNNKPVGWMARHPVATGAMLLGPGYGLAAPQKNASQRNQNDMYLHKVRQSQRARSMGGMTL